MYITLLLMFIDSSTLWTSKDTIILLNADESYPVIKRWRQSNSRAQPMAAHTRHHLFPASLRSSKWPPTVLTPTTHPPPQPTVRGPRHHRSQNLRRWDVQVSISTSPPTNGLTSKRDGPPTRPPQVSREEPFKSNSWKHAAKVCDLPCFNPIHR